MKNKFSEDTRWVDLGFVSKDDRGSSLHLFRCSCGTERQVPLHRVLYGGSKSCGCLRKDNLINSVQKHGLSNTKAYRAWASMLDRCKNKKSKYYYNYGQRGISVCEYWMVFDNFLSDMGQPVSGMYLDRVDNEKGYYKENCRWVNKEISNSNRRTSIFVTVDGITHTISWHARNNKIPVGTVYSRLKNGWSISDAFKIPSSNKFYSKKNKATEGDGLIWKAKDIRNRRSG